MLIVLSPAKTLDFDAGAERAGHPRRCSPRTTAELAEVTRKLTRRRPEAADVHLRRPGDAEPRALPGLRPGARDGLQAAFAFNGDVYQGLRARELDADALAWAQDHVRILSGLYGLLRPLDGIQPYRLEMGVRLQDQARAPASTTSGAPHREGAEPDADGPQGQDAGEPGQPGILRRRRQRGAEAAGGHLRFLEEKDGEARIISFFAKKARGVMARYAIDNRIDARRGPEGLPRQGYRFDKSLSWPGRVGVHPSAALTPDRPFRRELRRNGRAGPACRTWRGACAVAHGAVWGEIEVASARWLEPRQEVNVPGGDGVRHVGGGRSRSREGGAMSQYPAVIELSSLNGANGFQISGEAAWRPAAARRRSVASAGDVNGDGFDDLIVGAPGADPNGDAVRRQLRGVRPGRRLCRRTSTCPTSTAPTASRSAARRRRPQRPFRRLGGTSTATASTT